MNKIPIGIILALSGISVLLCYIMKPTRTDHVFVEHISGRTRGINETLQEYRTQFNHTTNGCIWILFQVLAIAILFILVLFCILRFQFKLPNILPTDMWCMLIKSLISFEPKVNRTTRQSVTALNKNGWNTSRKCVLSTRLK